MSKVTNSSNEPAVDAIVEIGNEQEYQEQFPLVQEQITTHSHTAEEFIETLFAIKDCNYHRYIFRGQSQAHWSVIASLFRGDFFAKELIDKQMKQKQTSYEFLREYYSTFIQWEYQLANGFAQDCMNQGIVFPYVPDSKLPQSEVMGKSFEYEDATFLVARNYGLPTRLVDFTYSPLIAAWFAVDGVHSTVYSEQTDNIVVWALNVSYLELYSGWKTISTSWANSQIPQMLRQRAVLLLDTKSEEHFISTGQFQPMEYFIEGHLAQNGDMVGHLGTMRRLTLPHSEGVHLMKKLMCNYDLSEIYLFPTLDRIAKHTLSAFSQHARLESFFQDAEKRREVLRQQSSSPNRRPLSDDNP